jgi:predicted permease
MDVVLGPDFVNWKEQATSFSELVAYDLSDDPIIVGGAATQERVASVSEGFWELSGVRLTRGRPPATGERDTLLVSQAFFEARLDGDAAAIGKTVSVNGSPHTIAGVLPRGFPLQFPWPGWPGFEPRDVAAYRTVRIEASRSNTLQMLNVVGRMKAGVTIEQARAELETIRARAAVVNPQYPGNRMTLRVVPLSQKLSGEGRRALSVLLSAVLLVLLIACANVSALLLGRASARRKEMAIRAAVGAGRARLVRQMIVESVILAVVAGVAGLLLARAGLSLILTLVPYAIPRLVESSIDGAVLVFTLVASLITTVIFGAGPALALGRVNLQDALKLGAKPSSSLSMHPRAGRFLVAAEMMLAVVLLTGAGLLIKSFWLMTAHPPGFDPGRVLTMKVQLSGPQYDDVSRRRAYVEELLDKAASVPGVAAAGISTHGDTRSVVFVEGAPVLPDGEVMQRSSVFVSAVSAGSARALGMRVLYGRWISENDPPTNVVVNESLACRDFPGQAAVGRRIRLDSPETPFSTIVGSSAI